MKKCFAIFCFWLIPTLFFAQKPLEVRQLVKNIYVYTTYNTYQNSRVPANGLYVLTVKGAILIDTPWDTSQFQPLLDHIKRAHRQRVIFAIATHSHEDRTAGLVYYADKGIKTYTSAMTDSISSHSKGHRAKNLFTKDTSFVFGSVNVQTYYPGKGHTPDNLTIWFEKEKVLYGGCFIKSGDAEDLGNMNDASVTDWKVSIHKLKNKFQSARFIVPGHGNWTDGKGIRQTEYLLTR